MIYKLLQNTRKKKTFIKNTKTVITSTAYGKIKGVVNKGVYVWRGVPYARPPIGDLRFKQAQKPFDFDGVYDATSFKPICPQMIRFEKEQESEDCLYLNIFSPSLSPPLKPVMVFLHGGCFIAGSGSQYLYDGNNIAKKGVVTVTVNYRLGALGMLDFSFLGKEFEDNIALKDQLAALEWVYENIAAFGGNPHDITLCGHSAGAISVLCLLNVLQAAKYIKKAIAISPFPDILNTKERALEIAQGFLKFAGIEQSEAKRRLKEMSCEQLNGLARAYAQSHQRRNGLDLLMPVIDGEFLPLRPIESVRDGHSCCPPLLIGVTKNEIDIMFKVKYYKSMALDELNYLMEAEEDVGRELFEAYAQSGCQNPHAALGRDWLLKIPSEWYADFHSRYGKAWLYRFDYDNLFLKLTGLHAVHTLDLIFVFGNFDNMVGKALFSLTPFRKKAFELADRIREDFVKFIKSGEASWDSFDLDKAVKIFHKDGDWVERSEENFIRSIWEKTKVYKTLKGDIQSFV